MAVKPGVDVVVVDKGWDKTMKEIKKLDDSYTAVGWFGNGGSPQNDVATRAAVNEMGATIRVTDKMRGYLAGVLGIFLKKTTTEIKIPPRPFIKETARIFSKKLEQRKLIEYDNLLAGKFTARQILSRLGEFWVGALKWVITRGKFSPNSGATVRAKGSSRTLIDTGQMRNSTTHREIMK
jgi:hypothetical protein